ncbi:hypothetical protein GGX14DRAFT_673307 [Mycena pura]|uniref:Uncharacterized protein n=1 Tax=Mycena pura TaxID=153505 RepID=A0AAD6V038_9AGAR|nr:hypothetical protein GGX14DRAFT_673307 [Mycena pura]
MAQSGARKKKNKLQRERKEKEAQAQQTPVSPSTPSPSESPTPNDHANISTTRPSHITPRIPDSTPRDWSVLRADDSREYPPHPWRTIRRRKRRVHVCSASRTWERLPQPAQHPLSPSSSLQRTPSLPPQPQSVPLSVQTLPTPVVPSAAPPVSLPLALPCRRHPTFRPSSFPASVLTGSTASAAFVRCSRRRNCEPPQLRLFAGMACSPFAVALSAVFSRPEDILNGISLATWGMPNDERQEFLWYLPPDQLLIFAALTHIFISEPDLAPFLLPSMADYVEDFVERSATMHGPQIGKKMLALSPLKNAEEITCSLDAICGYALNLTLVSKGLEKRNVEQIKDLGSRAVAIGSQSEMSGGSKTLGPVLDRGWAQTPTFPPPAVEPRSRHTSGPLDERTADLEPPMCDAAFEAELCAAIAEGSVAVLGQKD